MPITRILAANRGEIVSRVARTAHRRGIEVVAVYASSDERSRYLEDADLSYFLGDDSQRSPYLDIDRLIAAARETECDAVHPGFGFLAENAEFARAVEDAGLVWIGPPPSAIDAMGGKVAAKRLAAQAGVAVLESIELSDDLDAAVEAARAALTPPLLVKPSAGGGGKGMHRVDDLNDLSQVLVAAQREASASFGDGTLFIERYLETARHVEVQVMADKHGAVLHFGTRDCSIQRRHQKIVEEAPAPNLPAGLAEKMCRASVDLARSIGYVGAGTVEFLVFGDEYAFLEMNTRLQVEHPVTEEVTGVDLVDMQIEVAAGRSLALTQDDVVIVGHAIEVRLYAEDPAAGYLPSPGTVGIFEAPEYDWIRWEIGVKSGSPVSPRYDPMIAKVIAAGRDRSEARTRLVHALGGLRVTGVRTNRDMLRAVLAHQAFVDVRLATRFLDDYPELSSARAMEHVRFLNAIAAVITDVHKRRQEASIHRFAPPGWRNLRSAPTRATFLADGEHIHVDYTIDRDGHWQIAIGSEVAVATPLSVEAGRVDFLVGSVRHRAAVARDSGGILIATPGGQTYFTEQNPFAAEQVLVAGALISPLPGVVVSVERAVGDAIEAGDTLVVVEAMKMEHRIVTLESGVVTEIHVKAGDPVDHDQLIGAVGVAE